MHYAALLGQANVAELLVMHGAQVNARRFDGGETPLHWAARSGHTKVADMLLAQGADVNATDEKGTTPLVCAADWRHVDVVELLHVRGGL